MIRTTVEAPPAERKPSLSELIPVRELHQHLINQVAASDRKQGDCTHECGPSPLVPAKKPASSAPVAAMVRLMERRVALTRPSSSALLQTVSGTEMGRRFYEAL